jgi:hypothetical protein
MANIGINFQKFGVLATTKETHFATASVIFTCAHKAQKWLAPRFP